MGKAVVVWAIYVQFALVACSSAQGTKNVRGIREVSRVITVMTLVLARHPTWRLTRSVGNILMVIGFTGPFHYMYIVYLGPRWSCNYFMIFDMNDFGNCNCAFHISHVPIHYSVTAKFYGFVYICIIPALL